MDTFLTVIALTSLINISQHIYAISEADPHGRKRYSHGHKSLSIRILANNLKIYSFWEVYPFPQALAPLVSLTALRFKKPSPSALLKKAFLLPDSIRLREHIISLCSSEFRASA